MYVYTHIYYTIYKDIFESMYEWLTSSMVTRLSRTFRGVDMMACRLESRPDGLMLSRSITLRTQERHERVDVG